MTVERIHRCQQCGSRYVYQASGEGCGRVENDDCWCPSCKLVVVEALGTVPKLFEGRWVGVGPGGPAPLVTPTLEDCQRWKEERAKAEKERGSLFPNMHRIWPGLIGPDGDCQSIVGVVAGDGPHRGIMFQVATWSKRPDYEIKIEMEYDLRECRFTGRRWP